MSQEEHQARQLAWDACYNAREIGGYPTANGGRTRPGALVRADNLHNLTARGQEALREYGVRTIIDLRSPYELERHPNPFDAPEPADSMPLYLNLPLLDQDDHETHAAMEGAASMLDEYIVILEKSKHRIATVIEAVAANMQEGAVLVHCHGGKDRTGIVVALLLSLVGVPRETIVEDYGLSETRLEPLHAAWLEEQSHVRGEPVDRPRWMHSRPETIGGLLYYLDREYGGVEGYLTAAGVTQASIEQIRTHLIEP